MNLAKVKYDMLSLEIDNDPVWGERFFLRKYDSQGELDSEVELADYITALAWFEKSSGYPIPEESRQGIRRLNPEHWENGYKKPHTNLKHFPEGEKSRTRSKKKSQAKEALDV